jgi:hypothetical protein
MPYNTEQQNIEYLTNVLYLCTVVACGCFWPPSMIDVALSASEPRAKHAVIVALHGMNFFPSGPLAHLQVIAANFDIGCCCAGTAFCLYLIVAWVQ